MVASVPDAGPFFAISTYIEPISGCTALGFRETGFRGQRQRRQNEPSNPSGLRQRPCGHAINSSTCWIVSASLAPEPVLANEMRFARATNPKLSFEIMAVPRGVELPTFG